jgi:hypothetical protein
MTVATGRLNRRTPARTEAAQSIRLRLEAEYLRDLEMKKQAEQPKPQKPTR